MTSITVPTTDTFDATSVIGENRNIIDFIIDTMVPAINDIESRLAETESTLAELVAQFNIAVTYMGSDAEIVTGTAPSQVD